MTRQTLRADVRDTMLEYGLLTEDRDLFVRPPARIGQQRGRFDLLRADEVTCALTNVWAFNVASLEALEREFQSWNYLVTRLRQDGAEMQLGPSRTAMLSPDAPIDVVYDPPTSERDQQWRADIFGAAQEAWRLNDVRACTAQEFHARALELIH